MVVESVSKDKDKVKPPGLNTVELLRTASKSFGLGAQQTMKIAEKLYLNRYITYPRTESTHYSENFNFKEILDKLASNSALGSLAVATLKVLPLLTRRASANPPRAMTPATIRLSPPYPPHSRGR